jgi:uncharacterized iron-regulated protein
MKISFASFFSQVLGILLLLTVGVNNKAVAQTPDGDDFQAYSAQGSKLSWAELSTKLSRFDVVLVGETHNDSIGHIIELDLLRALHEDSNRERVAVSMEMFDRDVQYIVDEYLADYISESHFKKSSRPWDNYEMDYKPIVEFARENGLSIVAANSPRRYVNRVSRSGLAALEELPSSAKQYLPPLPVAPPTEEYRNKWNELMAEAMQDMPSAEPEPEKPAEESDAEEAEAEEPDTSYAAHGGFDLSKMLDAQNVWDAGMAYSIVRYLTDNPGASLIHFVGSFHVESGSGIPDHLSRYRPSARIGVVYINPVDEPLTFDEELLGTGDVIIQTRKNE